MYELAIIGNKIWDGVSDAPFVGAVFVERERIAKVVRGEVSRMELADAERVIDAADGLVMAGFHDSHTHMLMAGLYREYPTLFECRSAEECAKVCFEGAKKMGSTDGWFFGFGWYHVFWDKPEFPHKETLDALFPDRPILLVDAEAHGVWVNSKALEICGITKDTKEPFGGEILRDENGEPTGTLLETASGLATKYAFDLPVEEEKRLVRSFMKGAAAYGITSINDVLPYFHGDMGRVSVYSEMDRAGEFTCRVHAAPDLLGDLDKVLEWKSEFESENLKIGLVKAFLDGVPTAHTGLVLEDYADAKGNRGTPLFDLDAIKRAVPEAHKRGLSVKLHTCGDASLRFGLDCYEEAIKLYGKNGTRHALEHCELASAEDIRRFAELGVVPSVQPEHIALTQSFAENPYRVVLGEERAGRTWPFRDLLTSAGVLAIGSDCPVVDNNPFLEIYRAITRVHNDGEPAGGWNPSQKLTLEEVLRAYTLGSAYGVRRENELGTLEAGKFADIAILDRDLFGIEVEEVKNARVKTTIMDGRIVFEA